MNLSNLLKSITTAIFVSSSEANALELESLIPNLSQTNQDQQTIALAQIAPERYLLVYFYPKADTPGCTKQACSLKNAFADLTSQGIAVIGVSHDSPASQKAFKTKYQLPFDLLADENLAIANAFHVPSTLGFTKRQAFLFFENKLVWKDLNASTDQQAADVLLFISNHKKQTSTKS